MVKNLNLNGKNLDTENKRAFFKGLEKKIKENHHIFFEAENNFSINPTLENYRDYKIVSKKFVKAIRTAVKILSVAKYKKFVETLKKDGIDPQNYFKADNLIIEKAQCMLDLIKKREKEAYDDIHQVKNIHGHKCHDKMMDLVEKEIKKSNKQLLNKKVRDIKNTDLRTFVDYDGIRAKVFDKNNNKKR